MRNTNETAEVTLEDADGKTKEVTVFFEFSVEPTEYEGPYVFYQGGAEVDCVSVKPFIFMDTMFTEITAELFPYIVFHWRFRNNGDNVERIAAVKTGLLADTPDEEKVGYVKEALDIISAYYAWMFEDLISPDIKVPVHHYPDSRSV